MILPVLVLATSLATQASAPMPTPNVPPKGPWFRGLGDLPGGKYESGASSVSANAVVVGSSSSERGVEAFRWTFEGGIQGLGDLPGGDFKSLALGISDDGMRIVGYGTPKCSQLYCMEALLWRLDGTMQTLRNPDDRHDSSAAKTISSDGRIIVGAVSARYEWTAACWRGPQAEPELLISPAKGIPLSEANDVSADGLTVVGATTNAGITLAFRWTAEGGARELGALSKSGSSRAFAVSSDGSVVVGTSQIAPTDWRAFRWSAVEGMIALDELPGGVDEGMAADISADGRLIVGSGFGNEDHRMRSAIIWDESRVPRRVADVLRENGVREELKGWILLQATAISSDGRFVIGNGLNPARQSEAWIARLK